MLIAEEISLLHSCCKGEREREGGMYKIIIFGDHIPIPAKYCLMTYCTGINFYITVNSFVEVTATLLGVPGVSQSPVK